MSDKPTGVFVRLPLSDEQREVFVTEMDCGAEAEQAILAIGTPVTGGKLQSVREFVDNYAFIADCGNSVFLTDAHKTLLEDAICSYAHDPQTQIAALEAEVVRLLGVLSKIAESDDTDNALDPERNKRVVREALKGGAA